jgi:hypothetical protein
MSENIGVLLAEAHREFLAKKIPIPSAVENVAGRGNAYFQVMRALDGELGSYLPPWEMTASDQDINALFDRTIESQ